MQGSTQRVQPVKADGDEHQVRSAKYCSGIHHDIPDCGQGLAVQVVQCQAPDVYYSISQYKRRSDWLKRIVNSRNRARFAVIFTLADNGK